MPKIKDLGINIVPGTMRPPEIGGGGGGCRHNTMRMGGCPNLTEVQQSECNCVSDQCVPYSARVGGGAQDYTAFTFACTQPSVCFPCNQTECNCVSDWCAPHSGWVGAGGGGAAMVRESTGVSHCSPCVNSECNCVSDWKYAQAGADFVAYTECNCVTDHHPTVATCVAMIAPSANCVAGQACIAATRGTFVTPHTPDLAPGVLSRDDIASLRSQLKQALENLDVAEKNLLPKTLEEVDAREKELQRELDALKARRSELKK